MVESAGAASDSQDYELDEQGPGVAIFLEVRAGRGLAACSWDTAQQTGDSSAP